MSLCRTYNVDILEAGVDEVARGCLFGSVFAAAVILDPKVDLHIWLNDSKKVTKKRRAVVREWIESTAIAWSVASVDETFIDKINIRNCTFIAMETAVNNLSVKPEFCVLDGNTFSGNIPCPFMTVVGGDAKYANIAAASILAKEHHDDYVRKLILEEPELNVYQLSTNVGYGSAAHIAALQQYGASTRHRKTFLKKILPNLPQAPIIVVPAEIDDDEE